jgi:hypothetical protein
VTAAPPQLTVSATRPVVPRVTGWGLRFQPFCGWCPLLPQMGEGRCFSRRRWGQRQHGLGTQQVGPGISSAWVVWPWTGPSATSWAPCVLCHTSRGKVPPFVKTLGGSQKGTALSCGVGVMSTPDPKPLTTEPRCSFTERHSLGSRRTGGNPGGLPGDMSPSSVTSSCRAPQL